MVPLVFKTSLGAVKVPGGFDSLPSPPPIRMAEKTVTIQVTVRPSSKKDEVTATGEGQFRVSVRAPAHEGKANEALTALLAKHFSVPRSSIKILHGLTGRKKLVQIG